jgi:hypothetical protein
MLFHNTVGSGQISHGSTIAQGIVAWVRMLSLKEGVSPEPTGWKPLVGCGPYSAQLVTSARPSDRTKIMAIASGVSPLPLCCEVAAVVFLFFSFVYIFYFINIVHSRTGRVGRFDA